MLYDSVQPAQASLREVFFRFASDERGAAAIDWVALTAGILMIGVTLVYSIFNNGVGSAVSTINASLQDAQFNVDTGAVPDQDTFGGSPGGTTGTGSTTPGDSGGFGPGG